jgi:hypothetical protein
MHVNAQRIASMARFGLAAIRFEESGVSLLCREPGVISWSQLRPLI